MLARTVVLVTCLAAACSKDKPAPDQAPAPEPAKPAPAPAPAPAASEAINFQMPRPEVGDKHVESEAMTMAVTMTDDKGTHQVKLEKKVTKHEEVLAVSNGRITRVTIHYEVAEITQTVDGKAAKPRIPHAGKSYIIDVAPDKLTVTTPSGKAPFADEIESVTDHQASLLNQFVLERILASKTFRIGETVAFTADDLALFNGTMDDQKATAMTFTPRAADAKTVTFDVTTVIEDPPTKVELTGSAVFDRATLDSLSLTQEGKVTGPTPGTMTLTSSYKPE
jgi:hypothetical protein